jgi:SAM-dependent methyltransferase
VHSAVASRFVAEGLEPVLDIGSGQGDLLKLLAGQVFAVGFDRSVEMLRAVSANTLVMGDAASLPFRDGSVGAAAALYVLYHLQNPIEAIREIFRVLRPGGLFAACAPSRHDSPELRRFLPARPPSTFDAELGTELVQSVFGPEVKVISWDEPLIELPDWAAARDYLIGRFVPAEKAASIAREVEVPLRVTKRGSLWFARKT